MDIALCTIHGHDHCQRKTRENLSLDADHEKGQVSDQKPYIQ
jgi:hypothetical protein